MKSICVYCGSNPGRLEIYSDVACEFASLLVKRNLKLVYGGASVGIMGLIADNMLNLGGQVIGVIPDVLMQKEVAHHNLTELHVTRSMHERKTLMAELSDGFVALPGGVGTLEEIFEIWTWAQLGLHQKPCGLLNIEGYFNSLIQFLDHATAEEFIKSFHYSMLIIEDKPETLLDRFENYNPPVTQQWIGKTET